MVSKTSKKKKNQQQQITILQSMYSLYNLPRTCFIIVTIFREIISKFSLKHTAIVYNKHTFVVMSTEHILVKIIKYIIYKIILLIHCQYNLFGTVIRRCASLCYSSCFQTSIFDPDWILSV